MLAGVTGDVLTAGPNTYLAPNALPGPNPDGPVTGQPAECRGS